MSISTPSEQNTLSSVGEFAFKATKVPVHYPQQIATTRHSWPAVVITFVVAGIHLLALLAIVQNSRVQPQTTTPPSISGVLITASPTIPTPPKQQPKPKPKIKPKPKPLPPSKPVTPPPVTQQAPPPEPPVEPVEQATEAEETLEPSPPPEEPPRVDAQHNSNPAPRYPRTSLRLKEEGTVILELLIQSDGKVGEVRIKNSSGFPRLDRAALKAVKRWRYIPAQQAGEFINFWYEQPVVFALRK